LVRCHFLLLTLLALNGGWGQTSPLNEYLNILPSGRIALPGNVPPAIRGRLPLGPADPSQPMERMILALRMTPEARVRRDRLLAAQQDPSSGQYHAWLQPEAYAAAFGPAPGDVAKVTAWLRTQGFTVDRVARGGMHLVFSGDVGTVQRAFQTPIQRFALGGTEHQANGADPSIPAELAGIVAGVVSLHDLPRKAANTGARPLVSPLDTTAAGNFLAPADFAAIYNLAPLLALGLDGTGAGIAVVGRSNPGLADVTAFASTFLLKPGGTSIVLNGPDPGSVSFSENVEALLDMEWALGTAPGAAIQFVCSASTSASDGVDLSAAYAVDNNLAPVLSVSFGDCESNLGQTELAFYEDLWAQAAAQGITVCVASGDAGAAGCDPPSAPSGTGLGVNGLASTPSNVCVGGTMFNDGGAIHWSPPNSLDGQSVLGYIPELPWNESGTQPLGSGLWAGGGGASGTYAKPYWQAGPGVPADGRRDVPDLAFNAGFHNGYMVMQDGVLEVVAGTSAATPAFAGIMALLVQKTGQRQGNANPMLYALASSGSQAFHDILAGNNSVPGTAGFKAGVGYDQATGLGSLDAALFVNGLDGLSLAPAQVMATVKVGAAFTQGFTTTNGTAPCTYSVAQGPLPPGLTLSSDGILAGMLPLEGAYPFVIKATDARGRSAGATGFLQVGPVTITAGTGSVGQMAGQAATFAATVGGAVDTSASWTCPGGALTPAGPASVTFSALSAGSYTLTAAATANPARTVSVSVEVHDADFVNGHAGAPLTGLDALYLAGVAGTRDPMADLNGDGVVDAQDLAVLLAALGW